MAQVTFKGSPISTNGNLPAIGQVAPDFTLVAADLSENHWLTLQANAKC